MATPAHYREAQLWLANALEQSAHWRTEKAAEYPGDPRNPRAATALHQAAYYLRGTEGSPGIQAFAELVHDSNASDIDLVGPQYVYGLPGAESQRIAARYFFDHFAGVPEVASHEQLLRELYPATLRDLSELDVSPGSPLAVRIARDEPSALIGASPRPSLSKDEPPSSNVAQLIAISRLLVRIAETAAQEADPDGRLPTLYQPTNVPLLRRQLGVEATALVALGGTRLEAVRKIVEEPPLFAAATRAAVFSALEEVDAQLKLLGS